MYDMRQLELEWKKYRKKKLRAWYIFFLILMLLSGATLFFFNSTKIDLSTVNDYFHKEKDTLTLQGEPNGMQRQEEKNINSTVLVADDFKRLELEDTVIEAVDTAAHKTSGILVDIPILDESKEAMDTEAPQSRKKVHLEIIESNSMGAYKDVENRFNQSHNIDDALFLAKSYYNNGNYEKAEYWALQTNRLDETVEESLLIFVKSKLKLGNKNEAISILNSYLKKANSQEAQKLLYQIENDKL